MKTGFHPRLTRLIVLLGAAAALACLPDRMSWSPSGDRLAYVRPDGSVWVRGSDGTGSRYFRDPAFAAVQVFDPGATDGALLIATERPAGGLGNNMVRDLHLVRPDGRSRILMKEFSAEAGIAAHGDGTRAYFIRPVDKPGGQACELWSINPSDPEAQPKLVFRQVESFGYPSITRDGREIILTFPEALGVLDLDTGTTRTLIKAPERKLPVLYGVPALGGGSLAYIECHQSRKNPDGASDLGTLCLFEIATGGIRRLGSGVNILRRPMVTSDGTTAYVTQAELNKEKPEDGMEEVPPKNIQVVAFDLRTGERRVITNEPDGGFWPVPDPKSGRIAYVTAKPGTRANEPLEQIGRLIDPATGKVETLFP